MNWIENLMDLYDKNETQVGKVIRKEYSNGKQTKVMSYTLLPISHTTAVAQIEITIDQNGTFLWARELDKSEGFTIIPCTISSSSRAGKVISPHPLCDNLKYIAGDYSFYVGENVNGYEENFEAYKNELELWHLSEFTYPKVDAIYQYITKRSIIKDLITYQILHVDEQGRLLNTKLQGIDQKDSFVRFCVKQELTQEHFDMHSYSDGHLQSEVWLDHTLIRRFQTYYQSIQKEMGLCYLTGKETFLSELHPKKIRNEGDGAKLISGNDSSNFTYRGRFSDKNEAMGVSYEVSQKAHNALKWIIRKQGYTRDGLCVVTWATDLLPTINIYDSVTQLLDKVDEEDSMATEFDENLDLYASDEDDVYETKEVNAKSLANAIRGYRLSLKNASNMILMAFDSATPGRLAITYYKELERSTYLENIEHWQKTCSWLHTAVVDGKQFSYEGMASIRDIAVALYGTDQEGRLVLHTNSDGKSPMMVTMFQRLTPCILDRAPIPKDMVRTAVNRASMPLAYTPTNWRKLLGIACSFVRKERYDDKKEEWSMQTDMKGINDRSFLYGRLLAIADRIEYTTYDPDEKKRVTNAKRYMNTFSQRPFHTWKHIEERLQPYLQKQKYRAFYEHMLDEVMSLFEPDQFADDNKLDGLYLLGFHKQSEELRRKKEEDKKKTKAVIDGDDTKEEEGNEYIK